jgi:hypothetical protein
VGLLIKWQFTDKQFKTTQLFTWVVLFLIFYSSSTQLNYDSKGAVFDSSSTLLIFGFLLASYQFTFLGRQPLLATNYLLIPVSTFERTITAFVLSSIYYIVIVVATYIAAHLSEFAVSRLFGGTHAPINWDFLSIQGIKVRPSVLGAYNQISIWSLSGKIFFIQAFAILAQFLVKKNSINTLISILVFLIIYFLIINPYSFQIYKSIINSSNLDSQTATPDLITLIKSKATYIYILLALIIWRINYSVLSNKQL